MHIQSRTIYQCEFCGRWRLTKKAMRAHEKICWNNHNRVPLVGEITSARQLSSINDDCTWWPHDKGYQGTGCGCIWDGAQWIDVPGYLHNTRPGNQDGTWLRVDDEVWPANLDNEPRDYRIVIAKRLLAGVEGGGG